MIGKILPDGARVSLLISYYFFGFVMTLLSACCITVTVSSIQVFEMGAFHLKKGFSTLRDGQKCITYHHLESEVRTAGYIQYFKIFTGGLHDVTITNAYRLGHERGRLDW